MSARAPYEVVDTLFLWYLGLPARPVLVGEIHLALNGRGVSLRYGREWIKTGFPLSEDLPLLDMEHLPREKDVAAGSVDDARPDRWGERVIRQLERPPRLSILEMLYFAGDERFGALGVSTSEERYAPCARGALPTLADVDAVHELVRKLLADEMIGIDEVSRRLIAPGATMGGTRPKALIEIDGEPWVLKFAEAEMSSEPLVEHAAMTLAAKAGIVVAETRVIKLAKGAAVAIKRFDRAISTVTGRVKTQRLHALSANVALKAAGAALSYPNLAQLLRRRGSPVGGTDRQQMRELFRRLIFNILIDNTDDHEKNHVLLATDSQHYLLSPAFDVLPTAQALGYQSMIVGHEGTISSVENAMSMSQAYGLNRTEALAEAARVAEVVNDWQTHFAASSVDRNTINSLADQIDRAYLLVQRKALAG
ncbi:MAG: HipA domain-containing protein [Burkholderiales bacterium]|nr:HipA domain-containing protein [Burkholderiales bacterium]